MATPSRRKTTALKRLSRYPQLFGFFQAVRLLEKTSIEDVKAGALDDQADQPLGQAKTPAQEILRFQHNNSLSFSAGELEKLEQQQQQSGPYVIRQWLLVTNLLGLTGAQGVMPRHYSELLLQRSRAKDTNLAAFFDLFNHRSLSLFYRCGQKYQLPFLYERARLKETQPNQEDQFSQSLRALSGLQTAQLRQRLLLPDEGLMGYAALFWNQRCPRISLERMLSAVFDTAAKVEEFHGQWQPLLKDMRTQLPGFLHRGQNNLLGVNSLLGSHCWQIQNKIRIHLQCQSQAEFASFTPGSKKLRAVHQLIRYAVGIEIDFELIIQVLRQHLTSFCLSYETILDPSKDTHIGRLGWNSLLTSKARATEEIQIVLSEQACLLESTSKCHGYQLKAVTQDK